MLPCIVDPGLGHFLADPDGKDLPQQHPLAVGLAMVAAAAIMCLLNVVA